MFTIPTHRRLALAGVTVATGLALAGCGGSHDGDHASGSAATTTPAATTAAPASAAAVDRAFVAQMVPHHRMAVEMAEMAASKAERGEIKSLAREIVASQGKEITALTAVAERLGVAPAATPDHGSGGMDHGSSSTDHGAHGGSAMATDAETLGLSMDQMGMSMDMTALADAESFDRAFIDDMVPHHEGAIRMSRAVLERGSDAELQRLARQIIGAQERELRQMRQWRADWFGGTSGS